MSLVGGTVAPEVVRVARDVRFDVGLYSPREAARLARVSPQTLSNWLRGYRYAVGGRSARAKPVLHPMKLGRDSALSFVNLVEAAALARFREAGVSMQRVRKALSYVQGAMKEEHPLATERILTDGVDLFWEYQERRDSDVHLVNIVKGGQKAFPEAVMRYLREMEWGGDRYVARWWPGAPEARAGVVVIDPDRAFGAPVIAGTGIKTEDLFDRFSAGEPIEDLAKDYRLTFTQVEGAIRMEARLLEPLRPAA